jgi:uncharacterized protein
MNIVVTGGTGLIGKALVAACVTEGHTVTVLTRGESRVASGIRFATWETGDDRDWRAAVDAADAVVHLAGQPLFDKRWSPEYLKLCRDSRVDTTAKLAACLAAGARADRVFVSASAVGYYGMERGTDELREADAAGDDVLAQMAIEWEAAAKPAAAAGVRVCHPRIGLVLAGDGGVLAKFLPPFRMFVGGPLGSGKQYFPWIHIADAVAGILHAIGTNSMRGAFNLVAPRALTMGEFCKQLGAQLGRPSFFNVPETALRIALGAQARALVTGQRAVPAALQAARYRFKFEHASAALADLLD